MDSSGKNLGCKESLQVRGDPSNSTHLLSTAGRINTGMTSHPGRRAL